MRGFAVIDKQPGNDQIAVWLTSLVAPQRADHTNAVVIEATTDADAREKVRLLTRCRVVVITDGSNVDGLPIEREAMTVADVDALIKETEEQQQRILDAVAAYATKNRNRSLVPPEFPPSPTPERFTPAEDTATQRALQTANYLARAWTSWLTTDEQRRRRTTRPRTNTTPWIMPDDMNSPVIAPLPPRFAEQLRSQPLV